MRFVLRAILSPAYGIEVLATRKHPRGRVLAGYPETTIYSKRLDPSGLFGGCVKNCNTTMLTLEYEDATKKVAAGRQNGATVREINGYYNTVHAYGSQGRALC